jgi:hypothetical protein
MAITQNTSPTSGSATATSGVTNNPGATLATSTAQGWSQNDVVFCYVRNSVAQSNGAPIAASSVSGGGLTWTKAAEIGQDDAQSADYDDIAIFWAAASSVGSGIITVTFSGSAAVVGVVDCFALSGCNTTNPIDGSATAAYANASSPVNIYPTVTTISPATQALAINYARALSATPSAPGGYTSVTNSGIPNTFEVISLENSSNVASSSVGGSTANASGAYSTFKDCLTMTVLLIPNSLVTQDDVAQSSGAVNSNPSLATLSSQKWSKNDLLIAYVRNSVAAPGPAVVVTSISGGGLTWTNAIVANQEASAAAFFDDVEIWWARPSSNGSGIITANLSGSPGVGFIDTIALANASTQHAIDGSASALYTTATANNFPSVTSVASLTQALAVNYARALNSAPGPPSGYTSVATSVNVNTYDNIALETTTNPAQTSVGGMLANASTNYSSHGFGDCITLLILLRSTSSACPTCYVMVF